MHLSEVYCPGRFGLSMELFPPKTEAGMESLYEHVARLMQLSPQFITCTYGAGGSTRDKTLTIVREVRQRFGIDVASHLTCVGSTRDDLRNYLESAQEAGVGSIVALRGDPPQGEKTFQAVPGGFRYANELVTLIRESFPSLGIAVAGYPEKHVEAPSMAVDLDNLKRKVDAGADCIITQLFYDNRDFFDFRERCTERGIQIPIIPGILPITSLAQIQRITSLCGAKLPSRLVSRLEGNPDPSWQAHVGIEYAIEQVREMLATGVAGLHFYVLNRADATLEIAAATLTNR